MKQANQSAIQWYEPEDNRRRPYATMKTDGILCFGLTMQGELTGRIKVGFLESENAVIIEKDDEKGSVLPFNGRLRLTKMAKQLISVGMKLPLYFLFEEEKKDFRWRGYIVPPYRKERSAKPKKAGFPAENMWLLDAYKWLTEKAIAQYAKSTPIEERRATAYEALLEALYGYTHVYGTLKEHLWEMIKTRLIEENKQYTGISRYNSVSLDAPAKSNGEPGETLLELLASGAVNPLSGIEEKLDFDTFSGTCLDTREQVVFDMLLSGHTVDEIQRNNRMTEEELAGMCTEIGVRWKSFALIDAVV